MTTTFSTINSNKHTATFKEIGSVTITFTTLQAAQEFAAKIGKGTRAFNKAQKRALSGIVLPARVPFFFR